MVKVAISGGFDPLHPGHISYIEGALGIGDRLIVILTRDDQLWKKKSRKPIPFEVRRAVLEWGLKGRGWIVTNMDDDITVCKSLRYYKPDIFAKGGNTWDIENLPERQVCEDLGIRVVFGIGGYDKPFSSSDLR